MRHSPLNPSPGESARAALRFKVSGTADAVHELTAETSEDCRGQPKLSRGALLCSAGGPVVDRQAHRGLPKATAAQSGRPD